MKHEQIKKILEHFKGKTVNNKILKEYCNLNHLDLITESQYEDYVFQQEHDDRATKTLAGIFAELSQFKYIPTFLSESEKKKINEANEDIEWKIAKVLEDNGILYKEIDLLTKNLANAFQAIMENAGRRANNMCAVVLSTLAKDKFGDPLSLKSLGGFYRAKAKELGIKLHKTQEDIIVDEKLD